MLCTCNHTNIMGWYLGDVLQNYSTVVSIRRKWMKGFFSQIHFQMKNHVSNMFTYSLLLVDVWGFVISSVKGTQGSQNSSYHHIAPSVFQKPIPNSPPPSPFKINMKPKGEIHAWSEGTNLPPACFTPLCLIDRNCMHQRKRTLRFNGHKMDISILKRWINTLIRAIFIQHFQWDRHSAQAPNGA